MLAMARRRAVKREGHAPDYWMSYSDLMAGLIFTFILLVVIAIAQLKQEKVKVAAQGEHFAMALQENMQMKQEIEQLLGVKHDIISELQLEFGDRIQIDEQTGAITFSDNVLFAYNSAELSDNGKQELREFMPSYVNVLLSDRFRPHIAQIIIEGHTDQTGTYLYNLRLSQNRALAVVEYLLGPEFPPFPQQSDLSLLLTANGRSYSELRVIDGVVDDAASRRVEFKFRLKDEEAIQRVKNLLEQSEKP